MELQKPKSMPELKPKVKALYDAVLELLNENADVNALTVADITKRAGIGKGTAYDYFSCKEEIIAGAIIYDAQTQDVHCGGSGCGCSAAVLTGFLLNGMKQGRWRRLLFCGTGALLSPTSTLQGESIPSICHAVAISTEQ